MQKIEDGNKRLELMDNLRVMATLGVLFIHLSGWFLTQNAEPSQFYAFLADISRFSVPMFVFISSFLFFYKYKSSTINKKKYYKGRFVSIFIPYLVVSLIYYFYGMSPLVSPKVKVGLGGVDAVEYFIRMVLTKGVFSHLYFVPAILMFYFAAPALLRALKKRRAATLAALVVVNGVFVYYVNYISLPSISWRWTIFPYLIYVALGYVAAEKYEKMGKFSKSSIFAFWVVTTLAILFIYEPYNSGDLNMVWYSKYVYDSLFGLFWFLAFSLLRVPNKIQKILAYFSKKAFGIYLFHYMLIDLYFSLIIKGKINPVLNVTQYVISLVLIVVISVCLYGLVERLIGAISFNKKCRKKDSGHVQS